MEVIQKLLEKYVTEWNTKSVGATVPYSQVITDLDQVLQLLQPNVIKSVCNCPNPDPYEEEPNVCFRCEGIIKQTVL